MTQLQELQQIRSVTSDNHLEVIRKMLGAVHELDTRTVKLADWAGSQDMSLMNVLTELKTGQQELRTEIHQLRKDSNQRLDRLEVGQQQLQEEMRQTREDLQQEMRQTREETVELLRMIADNTRR